MPRALPQLDHYVGRLVERVQARDAGSAVYLEGGIQIVLEKYGPPNEIVGWQFMSTRREANNVFLKFGQSVGGGNFGAQREIQVKQDEWQVFWPEMEEDEQVDLEASRPVDPSALRDKGGADA
jgi:hypothetical protein